MAEGLFKLVVVALFALAVWGFVRPRYVFVIRIRNGQPCVRSGQVTTAFLGRVTAACQANGVQRGWIGGVLKGRQTTLRFSWGFPADLQQRLRNDWQTVG